MTTIYLIRHGAYENPLKIFHGRLSGFPLSKEGTKQATRMAEFLATKPITAVYASRLDRARQTAETIAEKFNLPVWTDDRLLDLRTPLQGLPLGFIRRPAFSFYHPVFIAAGGETMLELFERMDHFTRQKAADHPNEHIVAVSHGDGIMTLVTKYMKKKLPKYFPYDGTYVKEGQGYRIECDTGVVKKVIPIP